MGFTPHPLCREAISKGHPSFRWRYHQPVLGTAYPRTYLSGMSTTTPRIDLPRPREGGPEAPEKLTFRQRIRRALDAYHQARAMRPATEIVPIGHPRAREQRPGERRIVFGHNVIITRPRNAKPHPPQPPDKG